MGHKFRYLMPFFLFFLLFFIHRRRGSRRGNGELDYEMGNCTFSDDVKV